MMDADYADDLALLKSTPAQADCLPHSLELVSGGISLYVNSDKTEFLCFKQNGAISSLNDMSLKSVDHFIYLRSNIASTKST